MEVEINQLRKNRNCNNGIKITGKSLKLNTCITPKNPVVIPAVPWEPSEILRDVSEIIKTYDPTNIRARTNCWRMFCPQRTAETIY